MRNTSLPPVTGGLLRSDWSVSEVLVVADEAAGCDQAGLRTAVGLQVFPRVPFTCYRHWLMMFVVVSH